MLNPFRPYYPGGRWHIVFMWREWCYYARHWRRYLSDLKLGFSLWLRKVAWWIERL